MIFENVHSTFYTLTFIPDGQINVENPLENSHLKRESLGLCDASD